MKYKYYKGEAENPFDPEENWTTSQFWEYEKLFEDNHANMEDPQKKEKQFEEYMYNLLMNRLPDKYETESDYFLNLY